MFSKATAKFVRQVDPEGRLIHVSCINDSKKLVPMALVVKRKRIWIWQRTKYQPTDFNLSDLLLGDEVLAPDVSQAEFLTYNSIYGDKLMATLEAEAGSVGLTLEGRGTSNLLSCFGKLRKKEMDVKKLLHDSRNRLVDMQHVLVQQLEKRAEVLTVVKETIFTTSACSVTQTKKEKCTFHGMVGLMDALGGSVKVCVKDSNDIEVDSNVILEIPTDTVIAYSIMELEIQKDGHYEICLQPGKIGGFQADMVRSWSSHDSLDVVDGRCLGSEMEDLSPLAELPQATGLALFRKLKDILTDRVTLSQLQCELEKLCFGEQADAMQLEELSHSQNELLSAVLDLLGSTAAPLNAAHLLVSALEELPDESLSLMGDSQPEFFEAFSSMMMLTEKSLRFPIQDLPTPLQKEEALHRAERLLSSIGVTLRKDRDVLCLETGETTAVDLLVLSLGTHGLALICSGQKAASLY
ncbi:gasdermin-E-like [Dunckerocampus dactyliophorus]|uniref:gasdermin-E-like n=1 Tax=Dunckerocampus dactyliophorus TaxID=161453 RepID=UPI002405D200|nr:gasdermin-E-like [Dunckerocampus dactyliophorus]